MPRAIAPMPWAMPSQTAETPRKSAAKRRATGPGPLRTARGAGRAGLRAGARPFFGAGLRWGLALRDREVEVLRPVLREVLLRLPDEDVLLLRDPGGEDVRVAMSPPYADVTLVPRITRVRVFGTGAGRRRQTARMERALPEGRWAVAGAVGVLVTGLAFGGTAWALAVGDERYVFVVDNGRAVPASQFIDGPIYLTTAVLATVLVGVVGLLRWQVAAAVLGGVVTALTWGATVAVDRVEATGWGDGPDGRLAAVPLTVAAVGGALVAAGWALRARGLRPR